MNDTKVLIEKIKEGIQEKKGKKIIVADLTSIEDTICKYFVICQGNSPSQVSAIVDSIKEFTRKGADSKPYAIDGLRNAEWVAMDYADVLVHVFLPETRDFYNLEHLWADAKLTQILHLLAELLGLVAQLDRLSARRTCSTALSLPPRTLAT